MTKPVLTPPEESPTHTDSAEEGFPQADQPGERCMLQCGSEVTCTFIYKNKCVHINFERVSVFPKPTWPWKHPPPPATQPL